ncbi:MAG: extracellular solute-binding protein [Clostridium sp.]|uniref:extracellular solute-binding protein n=1 Tax=Clostridium TaxID=1485 RepID=UPI0021537FD0|nr:extracellular solute-binding protein [Clostridium sp. LY3-2]MCR6514777.1 extracellular solute-binding protein [Clostridium sp. LY3-2]
MKFEKSKIIIIIVILSIFLVFFISNKNKENNLKDNHLVVYSCLRAEETKSILELFKKQTGCSYEYIQLPTEEAVRRIEDEKEDPKADLFLSGTSSSLIRLAKSKDIVNYIAQEDKNIASELKDPYGRWVAFEFHPFAIVINKDSKIDIPKSFEDLGDEKYKGKIIMPNPLTSGTGYSFINYIYNRKEPKESEDLIKNIRSNADLLTTRGYNVVQNVASGEYPIGIAYLSNINLMKRTVSNIEAVVPKDTGIDIHGVGIINKKNVSKASKAFVNFIISKDTQEELENISSAIPAAKYSEYNNIYKFKILDDSSEGIDIWKRIK